MLNKTYQYRVINFQTRMKLFNMSIMNKKQQWKAFKESRFFSEMFLVFWLELFDLVNKWSQSKFNYSYLEKQLKKRMETFKELRQIEVDKVTTIIRVFFLILTFIAVILLIQAQTTETLSMQTAVDVYARQHNR